jgi:ribosomal protein L11 methyltransferase
MYLEFTFPWDHFPPGNLLDALENSVEVISFKENEDKEGALWIIEGVIQEQKKMPLLLQLELFATLHALEYTLPDFKPLIEKDWVTEVEKSSPAQTIGPFYIFGSHIAEKEKEGKIAIHLDAAAAFGSGRHESTSSCLILISEIVKKQPFSKVLDLGSGSGILAIALAKLLKRSIYLSDIDPDAVRIAQENGLQNHVDLISFVSKGFENEELQKAAPFDLIVANILALPLRDLAPEMKKMTHTGSYLILSGILATQEELVLSAYEEAGFVLDKKLHQGEWTALLLRAL